MYYRIAIEPTWLLLYPADMSEALKPTDRFISLLKYESWVLSGMAGYLKFLNNVWRSVLKVKAVNEHSIT